MPHLVSNLYEKAYTPFTAKLAPRHLWSRPQLGKFEPLSKMNRINKKKTENKAKIEAGTNDLLFRSQASKDDSLRSGPEREGFLAFHQILGVPQPQAVLLVCDRDRHGSVHFLVEHASWLLQTEEPPQISGVRDPPGERVAEEQA